MSLPKEPRQKMINMMYLVLTALLALNVSAEILNAFKTVNTSIGKSNQVITEKNDLTYKSFENKLNDAQTHAQAAIWEPKAIVAKKLSGDLFDELETLKKKLKQESGLEVNKNGEEVYREADLDAPIRLMGNQGQGKVLYDDLKKYKQQLLNVLNPEEFAGQPLIQADIIKARADFAKQLPLDLSVPKSQSGNPSTGDSTKDWVNNYFHMTPTIAALTILSKFQNDVKNSEAQMIDYLHKKIGEVKVVYDKFQVLAQASSNYVMPGDELDITAGVGAFSAAAKPVITINGQPQALGADGTADFKTRADGAGEHTVMVHIQYTKPDGTPETVDKPVKYTVGLPSGASVFLKKMNVVYIGVENPLTISGGSVGREKVHVSFTSPGASMTNAGGDDWVIKPTTPGLAEIIVNANGKDFKFPIRVKNLPLPAGFVGAKKGGAISSAEFKAIGGLQAHLEDSDFDAPFHVVSYKLGAIGGGIPQYTEATNDGVRWSGNAATIVSRATPGTYIYFDQIHVKGPDGKEREITPMVFSLK
ncbi:MAG: gliding motility protein GldM [Bacteroidota bacterium]|nr:gliding motility protein GldM [Bacteroidota bacterium]MDP4213007.1 gliding motility protein GldM [Bacteroidota bacterium]MDP4251168.1 gliding motility protein GldM [Bacteroidota bacterium]